MTPTAIIKENDADATVRRSQFSKEQPALFGDARGDPLGGSAGTHASESSRLGQQARHSHRVKESIHNSAGTEGSQSNTPKGRVRNTPTGASLESQPEGSLKSSTTNRPPGDRDLRPFRITASNSGTKVIVQDEMIPLTFSGN